MTLTYICPKCGDECEANIEPAEEIDVWCEKSFDKSFDPYDTKFDRTTMEEKQIIKRFAAIRSLCVGFERWGNCV